MRLHLGGGDGTIELDVGRGCPSLGLVLRDVVVELLLLLGKLVGDILSLRLLGLQLLDGRGQLEDLVLNLADLLSQGHD